MDLQRILTDLRSQAPDDMCLGHANNDPANPYINLEAAKHWISYGRSERPTAGEDQERRDLMAAIGEAAERALLNAGIADELDFIGRRKPGEGAPEKIPPLDLHKCFLDWYGIGEKTHGDHGVRRIWFEVQVRKPCCAASGLIPLRSCP